MANSESDLYQIIHMAFSLCSWIHEVDLCCTHVFRIIL